MNQEDSNRTGIDVTSGQTRQPEHRKRRQPKEVSTFRLMATLAVAGALAGLLIVLVNLHTKPIIDKYKAEQLQLAIYEVLPGVVHYETYYLVDGTLSLAMPDGAKESRVQTSLSWPRRRITAQGCRDFARGIRIPGCHHGDFRTLTRLRENFSGMKILDSKETPGLGDKIYKDQAFVDQFFNGP